MSIKKKIGEQMNFEFKVINIDDVKEMTTWRYNGFIKEIYTEPYFDSLNEEEEYIKGPGGCDGFAVLLDHKLVGLFEYYVKMDHIEIGLALHPTYVGKGYSEEFILSGINFCVKNYDYQGKYIVLHVDKRNIQAYKAYLKAGFTRVQEKDGQIEMR